MNLKYTISIENNSNKILSSSEDKFTGIGEGCLLKIQNDQFLYTVKSKDSFFYIKDFTSKDSKILTVEGDTNINLQKGDSLSISYKEYEAKFIIDIANEGLGYFPKDEIGIKNGNFSIDPFIGTAQPTLLEVVDIKSNGAVSSLNIKNPGKYLVPPENPVKTFSKRGDNLELNIKYFELPNRSVIQRTIIDIYLSEGVTYIVLDYALPLNLSFGKFSVLKNVIYLHENFNGKTAKNLSYEIFRDFTPNFKLPLMVNGCLSPETVYNKALLILDKELSELKSRIK